MRPDHSGSHVRWPAVSKAQIPLFSAQTEPEKLQGKCSRLKASVASPTIFTVLLTDLRPAIWFGSLD